MAARELIPLQTRVDCALPSLQEGTYFSEEQMRSREPLLYEQYIGQYLTDEEVKGVSSGVPLNL